MKILSIDVGIKNLAVCIMNVNNNDNTDYNIQEWFIINLFHDTKLCECKIIDKKIEKICNKPAKFYKNNIYYCKNHAIKNDNYKLPTSDFNKYKKYKMNELYNLMNDYDISYNKNYKYTKTSIIEIIDNFKKNYIYDTINNTKCNEVSIIDIGINLKNELDKNVLKFLKEIDIVLIENQISPIANRMNNVQGMLTQYFIMNDLTNIIYVSSINKLKNIIGNKKTTYNERKKISIESTKNLLSKINNNTIEKEKIEKLFFSSKKQDDLADSFLQAIWYIENIISI